MKKNIETKDILNFKENYDNNDKNQKIENNIKKLGIKKSSFNESIELEFKFNIETPSTKIYNQLDSHQCNIYVFLRVVKDILLKNSNIDIENLDISSNYINFFDKLEKANALYNDLINTKHLTLEIINQKVNRYIGSYGTFHFAREIVNKYGLVPTHAMAEVNKEYNDILTIDLLRTKIKSDAITLIKKNKKEKSNIKNELMNEVYVFLAKVYGNPPLSFKFNNKLTTPTEFKNTYLQNELDNYITLTSFNKEQFFSSFSFIPSIYLNKKENIISVSNNEIKKAIIDQLKDGISVWISIEESTASDYEEGILDNKLYNINSLLNIKEIDKNQKLALDIINYDHAVCITGALVEDSDIKQFKVDNSFGNYGKYKGQFIMTNDFFDNNVITAIINKKYILGEQNGK